MVENKQKLRGGKSQNVENKGKDIGKELDKFHHSYEILKNKRKYYEKMAEELVVRNDENRWEFFKQLVNYIEIKKKGIRGKAGFDELIEATKNLDYPDYALDKTKEVLTAVAILSPYSIDRKKRALDLLEELCNNEIENTEQLTDIKVAKIIADYFLQIVENAERSETRFAAMEKMDCIFGKWLQKNMKAKYGGNMHAEEAKSKAHQIFDELIEWPTRMSPTQTITRYATALYKILRLRKQEGNINGNINMAIAEASEILLNGKKEERYKKVDFLIEHDYIRILNEGLMLIRRRVAHVENIDIIEKITQMLGLDKDEKTKLAYDKLEEDKELLDYAEKKIITKLDKFKEKFVRMLMDIEIKEIVNKEQLHAP